MAFSMNSASGTSPQPLSIAFVASEFVTEELWYGGLSAYLDKISTVLVGMGHRVEIFTESTRRETVHRNGVVVHRVPVGQGGLVHRLGERLSRSRWHALHLLDRLNRSRHLNSCLMGRHAQRPFDIVQYASYLAVGALAPRSVKDRPATVSRLSSIQHLYRAGRGPAEFGPSPKDIEWHALRRTDVVFGPSKEMNFYAHRWLGREVATIPSPFVPIHSHSYGAERRLVTFAGKLSLNKGIDRFVDMGASLLEDPSVEIAICGEIMPRDAAIEAGIARLRDHGGVRVHILGNLDRESLGDVFTRSRAVILPSRVDNLPNVALEAMGAGAPIVASKGIGLDFLGVDGVAGALVDASRGEDLLEATRQVLASERRSHFEAGCAAVVSSLAPQAIGALHEDLYRRTISLLGKRE